MRMSRTYERILADEGESLLGVGLEGISQVFRKSVELGVFSQHIFVRAGKDD